MQCHFDIARVMPKIPMIFIASRPLPKMLFISSNNAFGIAR